MLNPRASKKRSTPGRNSRGKSMEHELPLDGVYANYSFLHSVGMLVGLPVQLLTKNKELYEGVLTTFGPNFDVVLDWPHLVSCEDSSLISNLECVKRKLIFKPHDIVLMRVANVDLDYATKENFATDSDISKFNGLPSGGRELEPWHEECSELENLELNEGSANGWDADDMFRKNEEKYGITTTYNPNMEGYTTPLQKRNTLEWKTKEARAQKIASEIERSPMTMTRSELENGDEEDRYSAVQRPATDAHSAGKYMPPQRRKPGEALSGKPPRSTNVLPPQGPPSIGGRYNAHSQMPPHRYGENVHSMSSYSPYNQQQSHLKSHASVNTANKNLPPNQSSCPGPPPSQPPTPSHSVQQDTKVNGEAKNSRRSMGDESANSSRESSLHKESFPSDSFTKHSPHQPPHSHDSLPARKPLNQDKEQHIAPFKTFGRDFMLAEDGTAAGGDKKMSPYQRGPPPSQPVHQPILPGSSNQLTSGESESAVSGGGGRVTSNATQISPPVVSSVTTASGPPSLQPRDSSLPPKDSSSSAPVVSDESATPAKAIPSVSSSKLNPNAKEFVFNPNAKAFNPRPTTSTPPRVQTPQIAAPTPAAQVASASGLTAVGYPQNMVHAYVMAPQPFQVQPQPRFQKRAAVNNPRPDYVSSMQVAAATGTPILASTPLNSITTPQSPAIQRVPIPHNMMQHTPQPYQCQGMPMMLPFHPHGIPMVTTMVPTSVGMYYQGAEGHQPNQPPGHHTAQQTMYVAAPPPPQQAQQQHHSANVGLPHPGQPPTPQGHGSNSGAGLPPQPPTPGTTPQQAVMYGASPSMTSQHLPPPSGQVPPNPYSAHNQAAMAAAAAHHHAPPGGAQLVMIPQHMTPHMMAHSANAPTPSSAAPYTSTSAPGGLQPHMNPPHHVQYIQGGGGGAPVHQIPVVHPNP